MALVQFRFYSEVLMRQVSGRAIIPFDGPRGPKSSYPTVYLLHGLCGDDMNWLLYTDLYDQAQKRGVAVILPSGENMFYRDSDSTGYPFGDFYGRELIQATRALFPLSHSREETFIAGFSMGGYGAICLGFEHPGSFRAVGAFSPALITRLVTDESWRQGRKPFHEWTVFGDLQALEGTDRDPHKLLQEISRLPREAQPQFYLGCGTEDGLIHPVRAFRQEAEALGVQTHYYEGPGGHDYRFWQGELCRFLDYIGYSL